MKRWGRIVAAGLSAMLASAAIARPDVSPPAQPPAARASETVWPPEGLDAALRDLESPDFQIRDRATAAIMQDDRLTLPILERMLHERGPAMSLEARERILSVARTRFEKSPRAAMGVRFGDPSGLGVQLTNRIVIDQTFEPFESHRMLEVGDIIIQADGEELHDPDVVFRIRAIIISHDPGQTIGIVVRRGRERLPFTLRLGSFDDLAKNGNGPMDQESLRRAWRYRAAHLVPNPPQPARADPPPEAWAADVTGGIEPAIQRAIRDRVTGAALNGDLALHPVSGGGSPRVRFADPEELPRDFQQFVLNNGRNRVVRVVRNNPGGLFPPPPLTPAAELQSLIVTRKHAEQQSRAGGVVIIEQKVRPESEAMKLKIGMLKKWEDAIRAEMLERGEAPPDDSEPQAGEDGK